MRSFATWAAVAVVASASAGVQAAQQDRLDVRLSIAQPVVHGDVDITIDMSITNISSHPVLMHKWQLPSGDMQGPLFRITREDGSLVRYTGRLVKRAAPRAADRVLLQPGQTLVFQVELTGVYDLSRDGRYAIEYVGHERRGDAVAAAATSAPLYLWLSGRSGLGAEPLAAAPQAAPDARPQAGSISYTGACSASQKTTLQNAVNAARNYANESAAYLNRTPSATQRYVKWFGAFTTSRWGTARTHFNNIQSAFNNAALTLDCSCRESAYAYVYPNQPYKIYLCNAFWGAPMTGTDSKGGTLIHEMSHFNVVAGTDDWAYGQSAAARLARSNPTRALDNADNHEYFAENTPALP
ncbi:MAG: M35 family metallo-endopeptidase [Pseudomonadota bacterium]